MKKRSEIEKKYLWNLDFYKSKDEIDKDFEFLNNSISEFKKFEGKLNQKNVFLSYLKFDYEFDMVANKLSFYIYNNYNTDLGDLENIKLYNKLEVLTSEISEATAFIFPEMLDFGDEYLQELFEDFNFSPYKKILKDIKRRKSHKIDKRDNMLISKMSNFLGASSTIYETLSDSELKFDSILDSNGNSIEVSEAEYSNLVQSKDRLVRELGFKSIMSGYGKFIKTFTNTLLKDVQEDIFFSVLSKFNSVKESELFDEEEPICVYDTLIKNVRKNSFILKRLVDIKALEMGLDNFAYYDLFVSLKKSDEKFSVENAIDIIRDVLKILGKEYLSKLDEKLSQNKIDFMPNENKRGGAYSSSVYGLPSVILMNFNGNLDSVYTLIHEMGHTLHSEFSNEYQSIYTCNYTIMAAEVASTVNEMLLYRYLSAKAKTKEEKKLYLFELLDKFRSTIFRQTLFSEFEDFVHNKLEKKEILTYEDLSNKYYELNKDYYGEKLILPDELKFEWARIPHFYTPFYVHKYATGLISAIAISKKIYEDVGFSEKYLNFLKSGDSKPTVELLKDLGVNLETDEPYDEAFNFILQEIKSIYGEKYVRK